MAEAAAEAAAAAAACADARMETEERRGGSCRNGVPKGAVLVHMGAAPLLPPQHGAAIWGAAGEERSAEAALIGWEALPVVMAPHGTSGLIALRSRGCR